MVMCKYSLVDKNREQFTGFRTICDIDWLVLRHVKFPTQYAKNQIIWESGHAKIW